MIFRWLLGKICMVSEKLYRNILNTNRLRADFQKGLAHSSKLMHQRWKQVKVLKQTFHIKSNYNFYSIREMVSALVPVIYNSDSLLISKYLFHSALIRGSAKWPVLYKRGSWKLTLSNTFMSPKCSTLNLFVVFAIYPEYYEPYLVSFFFP